ncbi:MAG: enoyl-CoA hydratase/isomerase family protein [Anaerolineae bacterium]|nr:enoyl-CoA hydratase/isomerase family protein [Anaerolineae bacterium]MCA9907858.1 enoyl-CoA hydratase/isomerase family protein [Anaerolineae bacterium]
MWPDYETLQIDLDPPFVQVTLNRPEVRNAMNHQMVEDLIAVFGVLRERDDIRAAILRGARGTFCAGGDFDELRAAIDMDEAQQIARTARVDTMLRTINHAPLITIAVVDGAALGGGFGLVCVTDVAIASTAARLGLPEVRLGLVPAVISPYVIGRVGLTRARQLMLTGSRFDGVAAQEYGIVHEALPPDGLDVRLEGLKEEIRQCAPNAVRECKKLIFEVVDKSPDETRQSRAELLNRLRVGDEAQEGILAFMQRRPAKWAE